MISTTNIDQHLLNWHSADPVFWEWCLQRSIDYGQNRMVSASRSGIGKQVGLVFFNDSLRTRASMEVAAHQLGAYPLVITPGNGTWGFAWDDSKSMLGSEAEHIREAVGVLSRYVDVLGIRVFASGTDLELDRNERLIRKVMAASTVPVVNLESAFWHPCQALADASVLKKKFEGAAEGKKFVLSWAPHPKALSTAVPNSTVMMATRLGMDVTIARPSGFDLDESVMASAVIQAAVKGGSLSVTDSQHDAFDGADVIYAKSWGGLGRYIDVESEAERRAAAGDWLISSEKMSLTNEAAFMHCLPVRRGVVVEDSVLDNDSAIHLDQAEYRLHAQKAILDWCWTDGMDVSDWRNES